ncbi:MAG: hypothetical protein ACI3XQ_00635 [Eubacteriales bacterium]
MKKLVALILALITAACCLFSCRNKNESEDTGTSDSVESRKEYSIDKLSDYDFRGRDFTILTRKEFEYELTSDYGASVISQSVYERNQAVESKYNVKLDIVAEQGAWAYRTQYKEKISDAIYAGDTCAYDLICGAQNQINLYVTEGYFTNLNSNECIDFDNEWWFRGFVDNMLINDKLYFTVGDAGPSLLAYMNVVVFNKDLCISNGIELPYDTVRSGNWTLEQMDIMTDKFGYEDANFNDSVDNDDIFSVVGGGAMLRGLSTSFAMNITTPDELGYPAITFYNDRNVDIIDSFQAFLLDGNKGNFRDGSDPTQIFGSGRSLLQFATLADVMTLNQKYDVNYGIVPYPKYDSTQDDYYTHVYETLTVFAIPINAAFQNESGIILEALGAASYDYITPEYFEAVLQYRISRDVDSLEMIELVRDKISFNFGFVHSGAIGDIGSILDNMKNGNYNFTSSWNNRSKTWNSKLSTLIDKYLQMGEG